MVKLAHKPSEWIQEVDRSFCSTRPSLQSGMPAEDLLMLILNVSFVELAAIVAIIHTGMARLS